MVQLALLPGPGAAEAWRQAGIRGLWSDSVGQSQKVPNKLSSGLLCLMREQDILGCSRLIIQSISQELLLKAVYVGKISF